VDTNYMFYLFTSRVVTYCFSHLPPSWCVYELRFTITRVPWRKTHLRPWSQEPCQSHVPLHFSATCLRHTSQQPQVVALLSFPPEKNNEIDRRHFRSAWEISISFFLNSIRFQIHYINITYINLISLLKMGLKQNSRFPTTGHLIYNIYNWL